MEVEIISARLALPVKTNMNEVFSLKLELIVATMALRMTEVAKMDVALVEEPMKQVAADYLGL